MFKFFKLVARLLLPCLCIIMGANCLGQSSNTDINFTNWQKEEGLPSNNVQAVVKDKKGFLWIGTDGGLCRYDGSGVMKIYRKTEDGSSDSNVSDSNVSDSDGLKSSNIKSLLCDSQGYLWIGTRFGGLTRFNPSTNEWRTFQKVPDDETSLSNDEVLTVFEDSQKRIWVGTESGLNLFDRSTSTFTRFKLKDGEYDASSRAILRIMEDAQGWIWVGTWAGGMYLILSDEQGNFIKHKSRYFQTTQNKAANNVWSLLQDREGRYWVGTHGGGLLLMQLPQNASNRLKHQNWEPTFHIYKPRTDQAKNLHSNIIQAIIQDQFGNLLIGSAYGFYRVYKENLPALHASETLPISFQFYRKSDSDDLRIIGNSVVDLLEDNQGMIWLATVNGLSQYNWYSNQFENFNYPETYLNTPFSRNFVIDYNKNIWVGHGERGMRRYQLVEGQLVKLKSNIDHLIRGKEISTLYSPDGKKMFVGTELGVSIVDLQMLEAKHYIVPDDIKRNIESLIPEAIMEDTKGFIWLGTKDGLFRLNPKSEIFSFYEPQLDDPTSISDLSINYILEDSRGTIWVASYKGLNRIINPHSDKPSFEKFFFDKNKPKKSLLSNQTMCLKEYGGYLYIGTLSGLSRYNYSSQEFESFDGPNQKFWARSIEQGLNGNIWISTGEGICQFNTKQKTFRFFDKQDGLASTAYVLGSSVKDDNENIYFAYNRGFTLFSSNELKTNEVPPPVYITQIEKMSREGTVVEDVVHKKEINLNHNDYRLSINYAALNYNRPDKNQYLYRLKGFEEKWNEGKLGSPIVYTNLEPKEYKLEVKAANNDGVWNEEGTSLTIVQQPAYWETWLFRILALFFLTASGLMFIFWYTNNIRKHNETLQAYNETLNAEIAQRKKVEQQLNDYNNELKRSNKDLEQFAYASSHDLKEPLRVIANFTGLLTNVHSSKLDKDGLKCIDFIEGGVERMVNVVDSLLTYSTVGRKDSVYDSVDLNGLLKDKVMDLSQLIKDRNALVEIDDLPEIIGQKEQIGMVFFNLINNAIKFNTTDQPHVVIRKEIGEEGFWKFSVRDNGIGIEEEYKEKIFGVFKRLHNRNKYEGTGIGLSVCQKIISRHKGDIWFESKMGEGTTFYFTIKKDLIEPKDAEMLDQEASDRVEGRTKKELEAQPS